MKTAFNKRTNLHKTTGLSTLGILHCECYVKMNNPISGRLETCSLKVSTEQPNIVFFDYAVMHR